MDNTQKRHANINTAQTQPGRAQSVMLGRCGTGYRRYCHYSHLRHSPHSRGGVLPGLGALCRAGGLANDVASYLKSCIAIGLAALCLAIMTLAGTSLAAAAQPDQSGQFEQSGQPGQSGQSGQSDQSKQTSQPDRPGKGLIHVTASRPFQTPVSKDMARQAGMSALRIKAQEQAEIVLAQHEAVRAILADEFVDRTLAAELTALAVLNLHLASQPAEALSGLPPVLQLELSASYSLTPDSALALAAQDLLKNPLLIENAALAAQMERQYLAAYDEAAKTAMLAPTPENKTRLDAAHAALRGIIEYFGILPGLHQPQKMSPALLPGLQHASALLPDNYLLNAELGRLYLWLEDSENSMLCLNAAIAQNPDFAQAYSHRGTLWLVRHKPSLALADFNRAIALAPNRAEYYYNRAVAWKTMGNTPAMCADLRQSCLNGHCDALEWAHANNECQ